LRLLARDSRLLELMLLKLLLVIALLL